MIKLLIFGILGFFALIIMAVKRNRAEKLQKVLTELGMSKNEKGKEDTQLLATLNRSFFFAKGTYFKIEDAYSRNNPTHHLLDIYYSSNGNMDITYQRLVFALETVSNLNYGFVVENTTSKSKILTEDLEIAKFKPYNYFSDRLTYVKAISQDDFEARFEPIIKYLVNIYPDICVELHLNKLLVYQNQTGVSIEKLPQFYKDIVKAFLPILKMD